MTVDIIPFETWHLDEMDIQERQSLPDSVAVTGYAYTIVNGSVLACFGAVLAWKGRYVAWAVLSKAAREHMLAITRLVKRKLSKADGRVEITVESDFPEGRRWARMLGFHIEAERMAGFGPSGEDHTLYARL